MNTIATEQLWIDFGLDTAVFLDYIAHWLKLNAGNKLPRNYNEGRYWTYNTLEALHINFPGWSKDKIRGIVRKCIKNGLLIIGNFNKTKYDRTNWYTLSDLAIQYYPKLSEIMQRKPDNPSPASCGSFAAGCGEITTPIPKRSTTSSNNTITTKKISKILLSEILQDNPYSIDKELIEQWIENRKNKNPVTPLAWSRINKVLQKLAEQGICQHDAFERMVANGWRSLEVSYFQQEFNKNKTKQVVDMESTDWAENLDGDWIK